MYSKQNRTAKTSANEFNTPAINQFAPRPFVIQPQIEKVSSLQNQTPNLQTESVNQQKGWMATLQKS
jgi:hypothetical protein